MKAVARPSPAPVPNCSDIPRILHKHNIQKAIEDYTRKVDRMRLGPVAKREGRGLLRDLKRKEVQDGPWPSASWVEAANRIMSDLVILYGVRWMLRQHQLPIDNYHVQLGTEKGKPFDIMADSDGLHFVGEAFSVAKSYFSEKMRRTRLKLSKANVQVTHKVIMFNAEMKGEFRERPSDPIEYAVVDELAGTCSPLTVWSWGSPP